VSLQEGRRVRKDGEGKGRGGERRERERRGRLRNISANGRINKRDDRTLNAARFHVNRTIS
jgi:hypothetical protein